MACSISHWQGPGRTENQPGWIVSSQSPTPPNFRVPIVGQVSDLPVKGASCSVFSFGKKPMQSASNSRSDPASGHAASVQPKVDRRSPEPAGRRPAPRCVPCCDSGLFVVMIVRFWEFPRTWFALFCSSSGGDVLHIDDKVRQFGRILDYDKTAIHQCFCRCGFY